MTNKKFKYLIISLFGILFLNLLFLDWRILSKKTPGVEVEEVPKKAVLDTEVCPPVCLEAIQEEVGRVAATLSGETKIVEKQIVEKVAQPATSQSQIKMVFIPLGGNGSTTNRDWTDIKAAEVHLDLGDYSSIKEVTWEAFLKVKHGNGKVLARLFDVTHSIGVPGSEISTNTEVSTQARSNSLTIWAGRNLYRVQLKSLTGYEATIDSGRIKVTLE